MRWLLFLAIVPAAFGQLDSDTLSVTSSRTLNVVIDQVQVTVNVNTGLETSLDDVIAALQGTEITTANLSGINSVWSNFGQAQRTQWTLTLAVPIARLNGALSALARVQSRSGVDLDYFLNAVPTSSGSCAWPSLVSDAQAQAQKL